MPLFILVVAALRPAVFVAPLPATHDPLACAIRAADGSYQDRLPPSQEHWFGTDVQGCDYFARVVHGGQVSLAVGIGGALLAGLIGLVVGGSGGFLGGWIDAVTGRVTDVFFAVPYLVGAILLLSVLGGERRNALEVLTVIGALSWPLAARIVRASVLTARKQAYVEAARALGASGFRVLVRHILPNVAAPIGVYVLISIGVNIGIEATLTFLGVGLQAPSVSWGLMIAAAANHVHDSPHLLLFPSALVTVAVLSFLVLGDVVRDSVDPRLR
jgi:ABC-type dipeptide/oligopeptide/nickel transport system permease subunit